MNIFVLDNDINKCAQYHCDQHVVKMILESAQIMCTALSKKGIETPYKPTHLNHPCVIWAGESYSNFFWLSNLATALNDEYKYRFDHKVNHKSFDIIEQINHYKFEDIGLTEFVQAMPEKYRIEGDAVLAYRKYYIGEKSSFASWKKRPVPDWFLIDTV